MRAYSHDLRTHLLRAIDQGMPKPEAARSFGVRTRTIQRYQQRRRQSGDVQPARFRGAAGTSVLYRKPRHGLQLSPATLSRQIHRLGGTRKKGRWWPPKPMRPSRRRGGAPSAA